MENHPNNPKETVLVTGATGFLGEYLVRRLIGKYQVLALGRNEEKGKRLKELGAIFCPGDFTDQRQCADYFRGVRYVIHAGALSSVWGKWEDFFQTNVLGTSLVARLCAENQVKRLVFVSSPSIYSGKEDHLAIREEQAPKDNRLNYYIKSKLMAEKEIQRWNRRGLDAVILRPRGLIGIGDTSLVPRLMRANNQTGIPLFRGGNNLVDLTSVENVALACELAMTAERAEGLTFNITNGEPTPFRILLEQFLEAAGETPHYRKLPFPAAYGAAAALEWAYRIFPLSGEPPLTRYTVCTLAFAQTMDISRAREILGYKPEKTLKESIHEYGTWWKNHAHKKHRPGNPPSLITQVKSYSCGYCTNNLALVFGRQPWKTRQFPATAVWIQHKKLGNLLYDTGYSEQIFQKGIFLTLYRRFNPVTFQSSQRIDQQLQADGIDPESVKTILLSHAHPDHVGGLSHFSGCRLVAFPETLKTLENPTAAKLTSPRLVPPKGCISVKEQPKNRLFHHFLCSYFEQVYDLFGDGSVIGVRLDGHVKGQMGLWIPDMKLFLAADACWGKDLVRLTQHMRWIPRMIQDDFFQYKITLQKICRLKRDFPDVQIVFSHQTKKEGNHGRST